MKPLIDLAGKRAVVTGGSRGVGRATALLLAQAGASVGIGYRSRESEAEEVVGRARSLGVDAWAVGVDLSRPDGPKRIFKRAEKEWGAIDIFVGNHGIWPHEDVPVARMSDERWSRTLAVNLTAVFRLCREAAALLRPDGRIVLVGSTAGQRGEAFHADYASTKGALGSLVKSLCVELAPRGITVNCVAPGWIETEMSESALADDESRQAIESMIPLGRVASAMDVAGPIVFLCSQLGRHVTGEVMNVNGGSVLPG